MRQNTPRAEDAHEYESELVVVLVRTLVVALAMLSPRLLRGISYDLDLTFLLLCAGVVIFNVCIGYAALRRVRLPSVRRVGTVAIDLALVTLWVSSGGIAKPHLFPLYYLVTIVAALWFGVRGALLAAALSTLAYTVAHLTSTDSFAQALRDSLGINVAFLFLVALLSGYLAQAIEAERRRRAEERQILSNYQQQIEISRDVQRSLIPRALPRVDGLDIGANARPSVEIGGGDYYDVLTLEDSKIAVCIADVAGKSLRAQSRLPMLKYALRALVSQGLSPEQIVTQLNALLYDDLQPLDLQDLQVKFITLCYAVIDLKKRQVCLCNAGHLPPLHVSRDGASQSLRIQGVMLGALRPSHPKYEPYHSQTWDLAPGDVLVFYTDGVTSSARNPQGEEFGEERLCELVASRRDNPAQAIADGVVRAVDSFERSRNLDDVTIVVVKVLPDENDARMQGYKDAEM